MKALIVCLFPNATKLDWNIMDSVQVRSFLRNHCKPIFEYHKYDMKKIRENIFIVEIEPNYDIIGLQVDPPKDIEIRLGDVYYGG